jgi:7,8-dihydropterin-6-yl-methyl-4-(beta-D-ribofuranosyl)aminobenzene 5'-phosphate synthase
MLITGEVPRTTGYAPGLPPQQAWLHHSWRPDPLVFDDQALILNVRGKGLVVLTGCGPAGVVNIARYARRLTGDQPLHGLLGGFHLSRPVFISGMSSPSVPCSAPNVSRWPCTVPKFAASR